ncbi:MAG: AMP-binding protein [Cyanobacteriota bacterium]|nr:AMP-binding protein [Cyanobacteriota bacterium]
MIDQTLPCLLIIEKDPHHFLAAFLAAQSLSLPICLGNPGWKKPELDLVLEQIRPRWLWRDQQCFATESLYSIQTPSGSIGDPFPDPTGWILIPTGGSSGQLRFAIHTRQTLSAAVAGFRDFFQAQVIHAVCVLPLYHVSGLMQFWRCYLTKGNFIVTPWKELEAGKIPLLDPSHFFLSLVPTQLARLLKHQDLLAWLQSFRAILLGGAPAWAELLSEARMQGIPLAPTYGMTETAAQICTLKPEFFLAGKSGVGQPLSHANITILNEHNQLVSAQEIGRIHIQTNSLALGYFPHPWLTHKAFTSGDLGYWDPQGFLHIVGRVDDCLISGGEKVMASEVEAVIRASGYVEDIAIVGIGDPEWGDLLVAIYVPKAKDFILMELQDHLRQHLSAHKQPKRWMATPYIPRNPQGKINRPHLRQWIESLPAESIGSNL